MGKVAEHFRALLVTGLMSLPCRICGAEPGRGCDPDCLEGEMICVDRDPLLLVHTDRAANAAEVKAVSGWMLRNQFAKGTVPAALAGKRDRTGDLTP